MKSLTDQVMQRVQVAASALSEARHLMEEHEKRVRSSRRASRMGGLRAAELSLKKMRPPAYRLGADMGIYSLSEFETKLEKMAEDLLASTLDYYIWASRLDETLGETEQDLSVVASQLQSIATSLEEITTKPVSDSIQGMKKAAESTCHKIQDMVQFLTIARDREKERLSSVKREVNRSLDRIRSADISIPREDSATLVNRS